MNIEAADSSETLVTNRLHGVTSLKIYFSHRHANLELTICMVLRHKGKFLTVASSPHIEDGTELGPLLKV